jgi:hypothetical protein
VFNRAAAMDSSAAQLAQHAFVMRGNLTFLTAREWS